MSHCDLFDSSNSLEEKCINLANQLIVFCKKPCALVQNIEDINSDLIVLLFKNLTNLSIPDVLLCASREEEAHNVQAVIDTLSLDLLGISLSHITGDDIVAGNAIAIYNLLEVLEGVALYVPLKKSTEENKAYYLKRKICRRKKSLSIPKSKSHDGSSSSISLIKRGKYEDSMETITRPTASIIESKVKTGSSQNISKDTIDGFMSGYPFSSTTVSSSSKENKNSNVVISDEKSSLDEETDWGTSAKQEQPQPTSQTIPKHIATESRPHFQIERVAPDEKSPVTSSKIPSKRNVSKLPYRKETTFPVSNHQEVEELYEQNFEKKLRVLMEKNGSYKSRASQIKRLHLQILQKPNKKSPFPPCKKSFLLPHSLRRRSVSQTALKRRSVHKNHTPQNFEKLRDGNAHERPRIGFVQELFEEFPGLQLSPALISHINKKYQQHLLKMHKQVNSCLLKKPKTQLQAEEAAQRQSLLSNLLKKSINQEKYLRECKENKVYENKIKYRLRDARLQSARMKQYCNEFHTELRKKMQKKNISEELILEKVFKDALNMQKEQVNYLCQEVEETGKKDAKQHLVYLDALENLYQTQFSMLSEALVTEKKDVEEGVKAQNQDMRTMQREFKEELKKEIRFMQKVIVECTEDIHFRELDAELYKTKLRKKLS